MSCSLSTQLYRRKILCNVITTNDYPFNKNMLYSKITRSLFYFNYYLKPFFQLIRKILCAKYMQNREGRNVLSYINLPTR